MILNFSDNLFISKSILKIIIFGFLIKALINKQIVNIDKSKSINHHYLKKIIHKLNYFQKYLLILNSAAKSSKYIAILPASPFVCLKLSIMPLIIKHFLIDS